MRTIPIIIAVIVISVTGIIFVSIDESMLISSNVTTSIDDSKMVSSNVTTSIDDSKMVSSNVTTSIDDSKMVSSNLTKSNLSCPDNQCAIALPIINATIPKDIAISNNEFAINFYKQIADNENVFFSPTSMYTAFSVLYEGAREETAIQMQQVFGFEPDMYTRHNTTAHMISSINRDDSYATLALANAVWIANWFKPFDTYLDNTRNVYLANAETVDFINKDDGVKKINTWAADNTNDKIKEVIVPSDVSGDTAMVITNAIYFKGTWLVEFSKEDTHKGDFWKTSKDKVGADFMSVRNNFDYTSSYGAHVLKMPYKGDRLSMLVILPYDLDGMESLEDMISATQIDQWINDLRRQEVTVTIPKFEMNTEYQLMDYLIELGMPDVFDEYSAKLHGIGISDRGNLYVDKALQKAYVKINEEGTEAAAVTTVAILNISEPPRFFANHPFIFIIYDEDSGTILFMGKVVDPSLDS